MSDFCRLSRRGVHPIIQTIAYSGCCLAWQRKTLPLLHLGEMYELEARIDQILF